MKLLIDTAEKKVRRSLYDDHSATIPDFVISEEVPLEIGLVSRVTRPWDSRLFTPIDPTDWTIRASLGSFRAPVGGTFQVIYATVASSILVPAADTTAADLELAMNAVPAIVTAGGLVVTGGNGFFVISFNLAGARTIWSADATQAIPSLLLDFTILVTGDGSNRAVQTLRIEQNIATLTELAVDSDPVASTFTVVFSTAVFTDVAHGLVAGDRIHFASTSALPAGLLDTLDYFVISSGLTADAFKVSVTLGGSTVVLTDNGTGVHSWMYSVVETLVAGDATHNAKDRITLPSNRWGGSWMIRVAGQPSDLIGWDDGPELLQRFIEQIQGVGAGNVTVTQDSDDSFIILFKGALVHTAIAVAADISDLKLLRTKNGTLDLQNAQVEFLLDGPDSSVVTLELEITDPSADTTKVQVDALLKRPVIKLDSSITPIPVSNYYTRDEIDALLAGISGADHAIEEFTATLAQTTYTLSQTPTGEAVVFINGLLQPEAEYNTTGNQVIFISGVGILAGDTVLIFYFF